MAKKLTAIITVILIMILTLSACSGGKSDSPEADTGKAEVRTDISGTWYKTDESGVEYTYVLKPSGDGYIEVYNLKFELKWETSDGNYVFNIDATTAYENMLGMNIDEIVAANLVDESTLHATKSGKFALSGGYLILMHDGITEYLCEIE